MEEKTIVKSQKSNAANIVSIVLCVLGLVIAIPKSTSYSLFRGFDHYYWTSILPYHLAIFFLPLGVVALLIFLVTSRTELTVTDKRVYGKAMFGKRVDLPFDSISAVGTTNIFKGISVATSSGKISFLGIQNADEIHGAISKLLMERQDKPKTETTIKQEIPQSNADELKKFKELLDSGVISQEEFDAKKKQLLDL